MVLFPKILEVVYKKLSSGNSLNLSKTLNCWEKYEHMASEFVVVPIHIYYLINFVFTKRVMGTCLMSRLATHIVDTINDNELQTRLHVAAAFLEVVGRFLDRTLGNKAVNLQLTLKQFVSIVD